MNGSPMSALDVYQRAADTFDAFIRQVKDDQWQVATPCPAWNVRDLVNHVVAENRWMPPLLAGRTIEEVGDQLAGDLLGAEPLLSWETGLAAARQAATANTTAERTVTLSYGSETAEEYLRQVAADHLVHAWDLAIAIGADDQLDTDLVAAVGDWFGHHEAAYRGANAVGPRPAVAVDADPQTRMLAMFGRSRSTPDALAVVDRFGAAFDAQDIDAIMAAMTPDCVFESTAPPGGVRYCGQEQVRAAWAAFFGDSVGADFTMEERFACGDRVVVQWRYDWSGGEPGHVRGVDLFRIRDGLVAEKVCYVKG